MHSTVSPHLKSSGLHVVEAQIVGRNKYIYTYKNNELLKSCPHFRLNLKRIFEHTTAFALYDSLCTVC